MDCFVAAYLALLGLEELAEFDLISMEIGEFRSQKTAF